jgi:hypothetical protein
MKVLYAILVTSCIFLTSCSRYYYKPNAINQPLFTGGMQGHVAAVASLGGEDDDRTTFADLQASFSPVKHLGLMGNYSTYTYIPASPSTKDARAHLIEGGIGGYYPFGGKKVKMVVELYGGMGSGRLRSDVDLDLKRYFIQPGIGMRSPWVDVAFALRIAMLKYSNLDDNGLGIGYLQDQNLVNTLTARGITNGTYTFVEPGLTVRGGYKFVKVQLQLVLSTPYQSVSWNYDPVRFTAGVHFKYCAQHGLLSLGLCTKAPV